MEKKYKIINFYYEDLLSKFFHGIDINNNNKVIIQKINKNNIEIEYVINEIQFLSELNSPYILKLLDNFEEHDFYYFIFENFDMTLKEYIKIEKNISVVDIKKILIQLNNAIKTMHDKWICHRDINPLNIVIIFNDEDNNNNTNKNKKRDFSIKLNNFIIAKCWSESDTMSTIIGSPDYMAPEVYTKQYKSTCDLYSIGVLICDLYYSENEEEKKNILFNNKNGENFELPKDDELIKDLIKKTIQIDPKKRISWDEYFKHAFFNSYKL